jgi:acyl carrier protein
VLPLRTIPKTTSGKMQRHRLARRYEAGEFDATVASLEYLAQASASTRTDRISELEHDVFKICAAVITDRVLAVDDDFFELGITSLALAQIYEQLDEKYTGCLDMEDLFERPSIRAIAAHLEAALENGSGVQLAS